MNNAKAIAEKIIYKFEIGDNISRKETIDLASAYLELEKEKARLKLHIDDIEKANDNCQTKIANLELEITKLKEENERLNKYVITGYEIMHNEMKAEITKLKEENEKLKKSRDVLRSALKDIEGRYEHPHDLHNINSARLRSCQLEAREAIKADDDIMGG